MKLHINGAETEVGDVPGDTPLLWILRDHVGLTGTKFGCGIGRCGSCTVHLDGRATRACVTPVSAVGERPIVTIEGLASATPHPVQAAWRAAEVPQCGYCQPGMIMAVAAARAERPDASAEEVFAGLTNLCRCGSYARIRRALEALWADDGRAASAASKPATGESTP